MPQGRPQDYTLPERDSQTRIQEIIAGMSQPEPEPGFWMRFLQAIPQALAVGVSQDPGAMLGQQIATQFQKVQIEKQRRQRLKELGATIEIEGLLERDREGRREAAENRRLEKEAGIREREAASLDKRQRGQIALTNRFQRSRDEFNAFETRRRDTRQNQAAKDLAEYQATASRENQFFAEVSRNSIEAIMSGEMDAATAVDLYSRLANKELPTKQDITNMNKAIKSQQSKVQRMALERIGAEAEARVRASGKTPQQAAMEFAFEFAQKTPMIWITDVDSQRKLIKRDVDPLTQQPALISGQKFLEEATPAQVQEYAMKTYAEMKGFANPTNIGNNIPSSQNKTAHAEGLVREAAKTRPFDQVKNDFLKPEVYGSLNLSKGEADSIIQRVEAEKKGQSVTATPEEGLRIKLSELDEQLKFAGSKRRPGLQKEREEIKKQLEPFAAEGKKREDIKKLEKIVTGLRNQVEEALNAPLGGQKRVRELQDKLDDALDRLEVARESLKK